ncbi:hypothetical protein [Burkholderia anthina]|uniref:hypothetical protein n=1 Tax=Burkholderia anthina TaxID=179879 RepID=UPI001588EEEA|nr:hypothetical protein [Burkholderia anthina]
MSPLIAARRMAPGACVAAAHEQAHAHACVLPGNRMRPVTLTLDDRSVGDAFGSWCGHVKTLLQTRVHLDDISSDSIRNAFLKP